MPAGNRRQCNSLRNTHASPLSDFDSGEALNFAQILARKSPEIACFALREN
jgi:hypothetical protein